MKFDPDKHHRHSIRLKGYDYSQPGAYFIAIVAFQRECLFGDVVNGGMVLSKFGHVAKQQWGRLSKRFPNIDLGAFVVMPNHVHGMIQIVDESRRGTGEGATDFDEQSSRRAPTHEQFQKPVKGSFPTIVRSYKSAIAYRVNLRCGTDGVPVWQRNYYEHIVRNAEDWDRIHRYIETNPSEWVEDEKNPLNT